MTIHLTHLPDEILCHILASTLSLTSALALSATCSRLHAVFLSNHTALCLAILPASLPAYPTLLALAKISEPHAPPAKLVARIFAYAREGTHAVTLFGENFVKWHGRERFFWPKRREEPWMSHGERVRFLYAYHVTHLLAKASELLRQSEGADETSTVSDHYDGNSGDGRRLGEVLEGLTVQQYFHVKDVSRWLKLMCDYMYRQRYGGMHVETLYRKVPIESRKTWWEEGEKRMEWVFEHHTAMRERKGRFMCGYPEGNPEGLWTLFDGCQDEMVER